MSIKSKFNFLKFFASLTIVICVSNYSEAQESFNSPYSAFGIGEIYGDAFSDNIAMGSAGVSTGSGFQVNNLNPALWVRNRFTTFDFGIIGQYKQIDSGAKHQQNASGNLAYINLSFPVATKWNLGVSLKPFSVVNYENTTYKLLPGASTIAFSETKTYGKGGINQASFTNSFQIGKYLSLGLESAYYFGNFRKTSEVTLGFAADPNYPLPTGAEYQVGLNERTIVNDFSFKGGAALKIPIRKDKKIFWNLGGTYSLGTQLNATQTTSFELTQSGNNIVAPDTLENSLGGSLTLPALYQVGTSFEWPFKLILAVDYSYQDWSKYRNFSNSNEGLKSVGRIHVGAEYLPNFNSLNYFNIVRYRLGFSHGDMPYTIGGQNGTDTNVSLGLTFPMGGRYSNYISVAFAGGRRGTTGGGMVRETYGKMVLGITLMDRWFVKQKIE